MVSDPVGSHINFLGLSLHNVGVKNYCCSWVIWLDQGGGVAGGLAQWVSCRWRLLLGNLQKVPQPPLLQLSPWYCSGWHRLCEVVHWVWGARHEVLRYLGVSHLGRNVRPSECKIEAPISTRRHYVCMVPFWCPCIWCRCLDEFHSSLGFLWLPRMWLQCLLIDMVPVYIGLLVIWYQLPLHIIVESQWFVGVSGCPPVGGGLRCPQSGWVELGHYNMVGSSCEVNDVVVG